MKISDLSRAKRMEFLSDRFVRHSRPGSAEQRKKRAARKHRWSFFFHARLAKLRIERYGLDVAGGFEATEHRRLLRNARMRERA